MKVKTLLLIAGIVLVSVLAVTPSITGNTIIKTGDNVTLDYTGTFNNGTVFDTSIGGTPLTFATGEGLMIPGFEKAVIGLHVNEEKTFTLKAFEAYGERVNELVMDINKSELELMIGVTPYPGMVLQSINGPTTVLSVNDVNATLDFNHPLAGMDLTFKVKILKIN